MFIIERDNIKEIIVLLIFYNIHTDMIVKQN